MRRSLLGCLLLAAAHPAVAVAGPEAAPAASVPDSFVAAAGRLQAHATVRARWTQERRSILFQETQIRAGSLELRRSDGRLHWLVDDGPQILFAGGKAYPALVGAAAAGEGAGGYSMPGGMDFSRFMTGFFTLDPATLGQSFTVAEAGPDRFELRPKDKQTAAIFKSVTLVLGGSPYAVRSVVIVESTEDSMTLSFDPVEIGVDFPADRFATPAERG